MDLRGIIRFLVFRLMFSTIPFFCGRRSEMAKAVDYLFYFIFL